jgi:hypothetical protein
MTVGQKRKHADIPLTPKRSTGAGTTQCGADNRSWRRELWLRSLHDPSAYRIQDLRDYGLTDSPNDLPPLLEP